MKFSLTGILVLTNTLEASSIVRPVVKQISKINMLCDQTYHCSDNNLQTSSSFCIEFSTDQYSIEENTNNNKNKGVASSLADITRCDLQLLLCDNYSNQDIIHLWYGKCSERHGSLETDSYEEMLQMLELPSIYSQDKLSQETTDIKELETTLSEDEFIEIEDGEDIDFSALNRILKKLRKVQLEETKFDQFLPEQNPARQNMLRFVPTKTNGSAKHGARTTRASTGYRHSRSRSRRRSSKSKRNIYKMDGCFENKTIFRKHKL